MTEAGTETALSEADSPAPPDSPGRPNLADSTAAPAPGEPGEEIEPPPTSLGKAGLGKVEPGEVQPGEVGPGIGPGTPEAAGNGPPAGPATEGGTGEEAEEEEAGNGAGFEPYDLVFYPQIGHCDVGEVIADGQTGLELLELTPRESGASTSANRILVPVRQLAARGIRRSGFAPGVIEEILGSDFEPTIEDAAERLDLITAQEREGTVGSLAHALKRLHLRRETKVITREEEKRRVRIRKWLVAEYMAEEEGRTSGQAQSAITRFLARTMKAVREREKEAAREARKRERAERKAEAAAKQARRRGPA